MSANYPTTISQILPDNLDLFQESFHCEPLAIVAQPGYSSRLRYRSDYENNLNRRGVLVSVNNTNYQSPAIRISQEYLDTTQEYYIRVCLVTIEHEKTRQRYIHPYTLEDIENDAYNDSKDHAVYYPIVGQDKDGIKSFPNLRIVKRKADDLKNYGDLHVFNSSNSPSVPQLSSAKDTIKEYKLQRFQLAFTIAVKTNDSNPVPYIPYAVTTIYSDEVVKIVSTESTKQKPSGSTSTDCRVYKYAPKYGCTNGHDEMLISFTDKLKPTKFGDLEIKIEYDTPDGPWSESVRELEIKEQIVSCKAPYFPYTINNYTTVRVTLKQKARDFDPLTFDYIPTAQCPQCQRNLLNNPNPILSTNPNKRPYSSLIDDDVFDDIPYTPQNPELNLDPRASSSSLNTMNPVVLFLIDDNITQQILYKLADSIQFLFINQDFLPILRIFRPFIRKRPQLLHQAMINNTSDLILKFISIAGIKLLQEKNPYGETILLHAIRLNRFDIVKTILEKDNYDRLLDDLNDKKQNIFHILALNGYSNELFDLLINYLLKKSIDIQQTFDYVDDDDYTPLQLATANKNLLAVDYLSQYFSNDARIVDNNIIDDIIQRAILYEDLSEVN